MNYGLVGLYGLYLVFVGVNKHAAELKNEIAGDVRGFVPWLLAVVVVMALYRSDTLKPMLRPFIALALVAFVLKNYSKIVSQVNTIGNLHLPTGS